MEKYSKVANFLICNTNITKPQYALYPIWGFQQVYDKKGMQLRNDLLKKFLNDENYDYVIIDAAPLGAVIDAAAIASFCDGAVMIISANEIHCRMAQDVKEQLERSDCKVLGAILNKIPLKAGSYYNNYYKKYYGRYKKSYSTYGYGHYGAYGYASSSDSKKSKNKKKDKK